MTSTIRIRELLDLVAVMPYRLGYRPSRSVVLVALHARQLGMTERVDLPPADLVDHVADEMLRHLRRESPSAAFVLAYEDAPGEAAALVEALCARLDAADIRLLDRVFVRGRVAFCLEHPEGELLPDDDRVPAVADFVALGHTALPDRETLVAQVEHEPGPRSDAVRAVVAAEQAAWQPEAPEWWAYVLDGLDAWQRIVDVSDPAWFTDEIAPADLARAALLLRDRNLRDCIITWLTPPSVFEVQDVVPQLWAVVASVLGGGGAQPLPRRGRRKRRRGVERPGSTGPARSPFEDPSPDVAGRLRQRLGLLARHVPEPLAPAVLTVLGAVQWHGSSGPLATAAFERALRIDPDYRLAAMMLTALEHGLRPVLPAGAPPGRPGVRSLAPDEPHLPSAG